MKFLRAFLAVCLALQFVMLLVPLWGWFTPHEHLARGRVSAREWQAHGENHRNPQTQAPLRAGTKIFSLASNDGLTSVFGALDIAPFAAPPAALTPDDFSTHRAQDGFFARAVDLPIPVPPPNA